MHACANKAMASYELLKSEPVSPFTWVGRASAMCLRMLSVLSGLFAMTSLSFESLLVIKKGVDASNCRLVNGLM